MFSGKIHVNFNHLQLRLVVCPIIYLGFSTIPGGCCRISEPSTVSHFGTQGVFLEVFVKAHPRLNYINYQVFEVPNKYLAILCDLYGMVKT